MERLIGARRFTIQGADLAPLIAPYPHVLLDLGTGDGRFVEHTARAHADTFALGLDACREQLVARSRRAPANALFLIANALALPPELDGVATQLTINFPWGSLFGGLVTGDATLYGRLAATARPGARLDVRLNAGAAAELGLTLDESARCIRRRLSEAGFTMAPRVALGAAELRACPSTWARRLAFGRDPSGLWLQGRRVASSSEGGNLSVSSR